MYISLPYPNKASIPYNGTLTKVIIDFLSTGRYQWWVPFVSSVRYTDERAPKANDFVGLNYYRSVVRGGGGGEII